MGYRFENQCCMCAVPAYPCTGEHKRVKVFFCDECKEDFESDYLCDFYGEHLCVDCLVKRFRKVSESEV